MHRFINAPSNHAFLSRAGYAGFFVVLLVLLYIPDPLGVVARVFAGEQFHNWDLSVIGPPFAYDKGRLLEVDTTTRYGLGLPIVSAHLMNMLGGVTYPNLVKMLMWLCLGYYAAWFVLLKRWLGGVLLPAAAVLFVIRTQMFHEGAYPLVHTYPTMTVLRFFTDIIVFHLLWQYLNTHRRQLLTWAGLACGFALFHMQAEGLYFMKIIDR